MIESLMKVLPVGYKVEGRRDYLGARRTGRYLPLFWLGGTAVVVRLLHFFKKTT